MKQKHVIVLLVAFLAIGSLLYWILHRPMTHIGVTSRTYTDSKRKVKLPVEIWYPLAQPARSQTYCGQPWILPNTACDAPITEENKLPLIILSHGHAGSRFALIWVVKPLVEQGYIVASIDHYDRGNNKVYPQLTHQFWHRPKEVSFVLDHLLSDPVIGRKIDPSRIGFVGFSLGGTTGIWLAGGKANTFTKERMQEYNNLLMKTNIDTTVVANAQQSNDTIQNIDFGPAQGEFKDERIKAFFLMAPAAGLGFDEAGLALITSPVHIVAAKGDTITPFEIDARHFARFIKDVELTVLDEEKANHYVFLPRISEECRNHVPHVLYTDHTSVERKSVHKKLYKQMLAFFKQHFKSTKYQKQSPPATEGQSA